jgi:hypothetical protein
MALIREQNPWMVGGGIGPGLGHLIQSLMNTPRERVQVEMLRQQISEMPLRRGLLEAQTGSEVQQGLASAAMARERNANAGLQESDLAALSQLEGIVKDYMKAKHFKKEAEIDMANNVPGAEPTRTMPQAFSNLAAIVSRLPKSYRGGDLVDSLVQLQGMEATDVTDPTLAPVYAGGGVPQGFSLGQNALRFGPSGGPPIAAGLFGTPAGGMTTPPGNLPTTMLPNEVEAVTNIQKPTGRLASEQLLLDYFRAKAAESLQLGQENQLPKLLTEVQGLLGNSPATSVNTNTNEIKVRHPDGRVGTIPTAQLEAAKKQGFVVVQ